MTQTYEVPDLTACQTLGSAILRYLTDRYDRKEIRSETVRTYREGLDIFADFAGRDRRLSSIDRKLVERWVASQSALAAATVRVRLVALKGFTTWCRANGMMSKDPMLGIKPPRKVRSVPRCLKAAQVTAALAVCEDDRQRLIVLLMCQEALRAGEVARASLADIDPNERELLVRGKGGHERVVPISDETWHAIIRVHPRWSQSAPLVPSQSAPGQHVLPRRVGRLAAVALRSAGVSETGHALRHTAANDMRKNGADIRDIQIALGHASITTTQGYLGLMAVGQLRKVMGGRQYGPGLQVVVEKPLETTRLYAER